MAQVKKTPLAETHASSGGKMVDFAGWWMPVEFAGLRAEHQNVRENAGLFDVSHMGEIRVRGEAALASLQWLTTNDVSKLKKNQAQYTLLSNEQGGIVDDLIVYCVEPGIDYFCCVNAANKDKDFQWMLEHNKGADITDESARWGQIALQGPKAMGIAEKVFGQPVLALKSFCFQVFDFAGEECLVARTGYTGEDGCEIFVPWEKTVQLWKSLLEKGRSENLQPIGLGARDTLRTEMKLSLYGHEIDDTTNPYEAGLGWVVKPEAKDFIGKSEMLASKVEGLKRKLIGFKMLERGIPRQGYMLLSLEGQEIGHCTSGTVSPSLNDYIGIGYVATDYTRPDTEILVQIRTRQVKARVCKTPFVNPKGV